MGGGQPSPPPAPPPPPSPAETARESIQAQIDAVPKILASKQEFDPQFAELELQQLKEFAPQFAEVVTGVQDIAAPEISAAQDTLTSFLNETDEEEFDRLKPGLVDEVRSAQSVRGIGSISPLGSIDEAVQIQKLRESLKNRRLNIALSTAGRQPIAGVSPTAGGTAPINQIDPNSIFNAQNSLNAFNSSIFNSQAQIFGAQSQAASQRRAQNFSLIPDVGFNFGGGS